MKVGDVVRELDEMAAHHPVAGEHLFDYELVTQYGRRVELLSVDIERKTVTVVD